MEKQQKSAIAILNKIMKFFNSISSRLLYGIKTTVTEPTKLYRFVLKCYRQGFSKTFINFLNLSYTQYQNEFDLSIKSFIVLTPPHSLIIAKQLKFLLEKFNFTCEITTKEHDLHTNCRGKIPIILAPQVFSKLPKKFIAFQLEQKGSPWFTENYLSLLKKATFILEYSRMNLEYLQESGIPIRNIYFCPIFPNTVKLTQYFKSNEKKEYDLVFYGAINSRRGKILKFLSKKFKILILSEVFGEELYHQLQRAHLLINVHFYEAAHLETTRLTEAITFGIPIVSETSSSKMTDSQFSDFVTFAKSGNLEDLEKKINDKLKEKTSLDYQKKIKEQFSWFDYYFLRFLLSQDLISFKDFKNSFITTFPLIKDRLCLSLPESVTRVSNFKRQPESTFFNIFPGLRHELGFVGCAYSYKFIFAIALHQGVKQICICEDDIYFPSDFKIKFKQIENFLSKNKKSWDVFSGLVSDFSKELKILKVYQINSQRIIFTNEACGLVFSIFSELAMTKMIEWEYYPDQEYKTIDKFMAEKIHRFVTVLPPIAEHDEDLSSTIWDGNNKDLYLDYLSMSRAKLENEVKKYEKKQVIKEIQTPTKNG